jgi:molybdopterin-guanine dinucleotide biosynthesis protein MobB
MKIFGVAGWKNSGKTGLMERLVAEICARGITVSTIKHAHHAFDVDQPGKDSHRHRVAGAREVLLASGKRWALMHELRDVPEPPLADLIAHLSPVDLVLIEGYKRADHPKIEAHRAETGKASSLAIAMTCGSS